MFDLDPLLIVMRIPGIVMGFTFHEFGHAWVATLLGDDTPRRDKRVTLDPRAHLDIFGLVLLLLVGFGWAKPVMVDTNRLRPRIWGDIAVSLAGVAMNLVLAFLFAMLTRISLAGWFVGYQNEVLTRTLWLVVWTNVALAVFNLIPLPPLDGFHVARYIFPSSMDGLVAFLYRYGPFVLILFVLSDFFGPLILPAHGAVLDGVIWLANLVLTPLKPLLGG